LCWLVLSGGAANKKELVEDVTRKAKQVERLIQALPDVEDTEVKVRLSVTRPSAVVRPEGKGR
jgi:hypothetical protein